VRGTRLPLRLANAAIVIALIFSATGGVASSAPELAGVVGHWRAGDWKPETYYETIYGEAGRAFNWLGREDAGNRTVTFTHADFIAPLFGWHGRNRVVYASVPGDLPMPTSERVASYRSWRRFLLNEKVDWIVVWVPWWGEERVKKNEVWIANNPDGFRLVEDFAGRVKIYEPVFEDAERDMLEKDAADPTRAGLAAMAHAEDWTLEYRTGSETAMRSLDDGSLGIDFSFSTAENDYIDWRFDLEDEDWTGFESLSFDLDYDPGSALLFVWLKNPDPRNACRFQLDPGEIDPVSGRISIELASPDRTAGRFDLSRVAELHLVIDDVDDAGTGGGSLRVGGFHLNRRGVASEVARWRACRD